MSTEAAAAGAGPLVLEEEPQAHEGDEKGDRLRKGHLLTVLTPESRGNTRSEAFEIESASAFAGGGRKLSPMIVVGVDGSESARDALAWALAEARFREDVDGSLAGLLLDSVSHQQPASRLATAAVP